jgi:hypothetical protein
MNPHRTRTRARAPRRAALAALVAAPAALSLWANACSVPFKPPSQVDGLRIVSVELDKPYAEPGDTVRLEMTLADGREDASNVPNIIWIGGCVNPPGGSYFGCYEQLADLFASFGQGGPPPAGTIGGGPGVTLFETTLPEDIVSSAPEANFDIKVGTAFVFFVVCGGELRPVEIDGETEAASFPLGCFDDDGTQLGPEAFVPGFTQVFVFEDLRPNANPVVNGLVVDGETVPADTVLEAKVCSIPAADRAQSGCAAPDEFAECDALEIDVDVPEESAEIEPDATDAEGQPLNEVVWVSYFTNGGEFENDLKLVADATTGFVEERSTRWVPPEEPGIYSIWAVVRDNRGGSRTVTHTVQVTE